MPSNHLMNSVWIYRLLSFSIAGYFGAQFGLRSLSSLGRLLDFFTVLSVVCIAILWGRLVTKVVPLAALAFVPLLFVLILGTFYAVSPSRAIDVVLSVAVSCTVLILVVPLASRDRAALEAIVNGIWGSSLILALLAPVFEAPDEIMAALSGGRRVGYVLSQPNSVGYILALGIILTLSRFMQSGKSAWQRILLFGTVGYMSLLVVATQSRRALIAFVVGGGIILIARAFRAGRGQLGRVLGSAMIVLLGVIGLANVLQGQERFDALTPSMDAGVSSDSSIAERQELIRRGLELFAERPLLGWGTSSFRFLNGVGGHDEIAAHNNAVDLLANNGIVGASVYYIPIFVVAYLLMKRSARSGEWLGWTLGAILLIELSITGMTSITYVERLSALLVAASLACLISAGEGLSVEGVSSVRY